MASPFFSVVIPTYNRANIVPLAVRSVLAQTFEDFEVIVSDNCSTDATPRLAEEFTDPRFKYVRTPQHVVIADSWEFARRQATGKFLITLSDDDALVDTALERFASEAEQHDADFLFCNAARYRDLTFPGPDKNSMDCPAFSGSSRQVSADEFVQSIFAFQPKFETHPSAYAIAKTIADSVEAKTGRYFWTNGVEFSAWPISAVLAKKSIHIDLPLIILGRTGKSWGSNTQICNPGKEQIQAFFEDVDQERKHVPLKNFTTSNLMAEGMLTAKSLYPAEFARYEFDELQYLRTTLKTLAYRRSLGVDVAAELDEALRYAAKYPALIQEWRDHEAARPAWTARAVARVRAVVANAGGRALRHSISVARLKRRLKNGTQRGGFSASGAEFGFDDILGCASFLGRSVLQTARHAPPTVRVPAAAAAMQRTTSA